MRKLKLFLAGIVFVMAGIGLVTDQSELIPYMFLVLGGMMVVQGIEERRKDSRSFWAYASFATAGFLWFVSISVFVNGNS
ncbi:DUF3953 domain-containing protein [Salimicrobium sp. PL1-032A]|uniref:DUF3953 domain-containing protein n=1 Tax=Salimicrobium sp. PL1-032A TaxID=3095364 RepID=UPI003261A47E